MIIGVSGYKGSGKDTFANILVEKYGYKKLSFARKLKLSAGELFGVDPKFWEDFKNNPMARVTISVPSASVGLKGPNVLISDMSVREMLQRYGTQSHRDIFGEDFWVNQTLIEAGTGNYVLADCRFENEAERISDLGGIIVRINRFEETDDTHESEVPLPESMIDYYVENTGTLDDLHTEAKMFIEWLKDEQYNDDYDKYSEFDD